MANEISKTVGETIAQQIENTAKGLPKDVQHIELDKLHESPFNPRKRFGNLEEIAETMRVHGVLQPLTVRPHPKKKDEFEIVFGHRRYRAAKLAKLGSIPVLVRSLSDDQSRTMQLIENVQREDVHPMEEAEAIDALIKTGHSDVAKLAREVGKSTGHVYGRLKLLDLEPSVRKLFLDDKFGFAIALLLARSPHDVQKKAAEKIIEPWKGAEPMSFRQAVAMLRSEFRVGISDEYNPEEEKKRAEAWAAAVEKARAEKRRVLSEKELADVFPYGSEQIATDAQFVSLTTQAKGDGRARTWKQVLGKHASEVPTVLAHDPLMGIHELLDVKAATKLAKDKSLFQNVDEKKKTTSAAAPAATTKTSAAPASDDEGEDDETKHKEREEKKLRLRKSTAELVLATMVEKIEARKKMEKKFLVAIAEGAIRNQGLPPASLKRREVKSPVDIDLRKLTDSELIAITFESLNGNDITAVREGYSDEIKTLSQTFSIDMKAIEDRLRDEEKEREREQREREKQREQREVERLAAQAEKQAAAAQQQGEKK